MSASGDDQLATLREQRRIELQRQLESQVQAQAEAEIESQRKNAESEAPPSAIKANGLFNTLEIPSFTRVVFPLPMGP